MAGPRTTTGVRRGAWMMALLVSASACGDDRGAPPGATTSPPASSAHVAPSASTSASPSASAKAAAPASPWVGSWTGTYRAEKAMPTLDPTVKVKPWTSDDGKRASGEGRLRIEIDAEGVARGELLGPLGPADVSGIVEGERLHAQIVPREDGESSFGGTVEATLAAGELAFTIRASDGAAVTVRKAAGKLARR